MTEYFDCPECGREKTVEQLNDKEAVCKECGIVFNISDEETPVENDDSEFAIESDEKVEDNQQDRVDIVECNLNDILEAAKNIVAEDIPPVVEQVEEKKAPTEVAMLRIPNAVIERLGSKSPNLLETLEYQDAANVPDYILRTAEWKFAKIKKLKGNPYKESSKSWKIFNVFEKKPSTILDCFIATKETLLNDGITYLLSVYNVLRTCHAVGLLSYDGTTKIISVTK